MSAWTGDRTSEYSVRDFEIRHCTPKLQARWSEVGDRTFNLQVRCSELQR
ncbi:MAG: hypothetical protein HY785_19625 [Oscillatoriophycideae cyanobacterium NC_groundwater_1537_Pr4_S-0.65um_50_18]|nr:hypothetical protein [Oscillatoriophycideae cyanobacterium NC_groundwater_1537_Pr4_S-0.65um_50_18]